MLIKPVWLASAALLLALPALAQQANVTQPAPAATPSTPAPVRQAAPAESGGDESAVEEVAAVNIPPPVPPIEYPGWARRDPWSVGAISPQAAGLTDDAWGGANGPFLSTLMRRMRAPLASRWAHIALRDALLAKLHAPVNVNPIDWTAERAWLLLRMGEADAARMLVAGVDVDRFTPKMTQVAVQTALASSDPSALCPLEDGMRKAEPGVLRLVQAMCASLAGQPESASATIDQARRYGRIGGIDLALAEKVVGAGANGRTTTLEWDPVDSLTAWRFGLATGTGAVPPDRLINAASPQLRAFQARAPMLTAQQRLPSAMIAAGMGVFSSQSMVDLYSSIYDATDPDDLPGSDAWQLRLAYVAKDPGARTAAIRKLLGTGKGRYDKEGARALVARAASMVRPDAKLGKDACDLISAMLAGGYDQAAARWIPILDDLDDEANDRCWAMLALAAPNVAEVTARRVNAFIKRDNSRDHVRSALLVAGLAGLGRLNAETANSINRSNGLGLGHVTNWTRMIDAAAARGQGGTVLVLTGTGFQTPAYDRIPASHLFHAVSALGKTGQGFTARMIAAEALSRT
ncbi:hypothetical protein [Sphingomonas flavescens]|uniref:hypothetical protein n=1 Tax=Sphingomonas flavescens TaxID=3132797 RepID=UPI002805ADF8|nr:hypothetical protein [Sphingomonas limnosediminicola]